MKVVGEVGESITQLVVQVSRGGRRGKKNVLDRHAGLWTALMRLNVVLQYIEPCC